MLGQEGVPLARRGWLDIRQVRHASEEGIRVVRQASQQIVDQVVEQVSPHSPRAFGGDGHVESSGDPTTELPAVATAPTAHTAHSTFARSTASRSLVASNRVRLEDLVTEHELGDSSEVVARRVAGYLDLVASIALPLAYLLFILVYLLQFEAASMIQRSQTTITINHERDYQKRNETRSQLCAQVPLDGRGPLQGDEVRPRVAARRRDVEVLLQEGPRTGLNNTTILGSGSSKGRAPAADLLAGGAGHHGHVEQRGDADVARR